MDHLQRLHIFTKVAELGGFSKAAQSLALSSPAVTRAISSLEELLGVQLFIRTTRSVRLTQSGHHFLSDILPVLDSLKSAETALQGNFTNPNGTLSVTAPVMFGRTFLSPFISDFLVRYPDVNIRAHYLDRVVNLMEEGLDVAIRIGELEDSSMMARKVGAVHRKICSSPKYLKAYNEPTHPSELKNFNIIHPLSFGGSPKWTFMINNKISRVSLNARLHMNTNDAIIETLKRGFGISCLLSYQVAHDIDQGDLQEILEAFRMPEQPVHILHQEGRTVSATTRLFVDELSEYLKSNGRL